MSILISDLKGFDFSGKYLRIHEEFSIKEDGKQVDFKIDKDGDYDSDQYWIEFTYYTNNRIMHQSRQYNNPFLYFKEVENFIEKNDKFNNQKTILIKNALEEFNPDFVKWDELTNRLSSEIDILKLFPDYKSSKIPQDLSKKDLAKYLDKLSKFELETLFEEISMLDFEIFYQSLWGEDYEYFIKKAFTSHFLGEKFFSHAIYDIIDQKRREYYIGTILEEYGFNINEYDLMVPVIDSIINYDFNRRVDSRNLRLQKLIKREKIDLENIDFEKLDKISQLRENVFNDHDNQNYRNKFDFNNLDNLLTKSAYIYVLKAISSTSKSEIVMKYKIPRENYDDNSIQKIALNNGHIKLGNAKDNLYFYTATELKNVLKKYGLKVTGNKIHLINRIKENLSDEVVNTEFPKVYFTLTEEGQEYLDKYYFLGEFYSVLPPNFTIEEFNQICISNPEISPDEIIKCLVNENWLIWDEKLGEEPEIYDYNKIKLKNIFKSRTREDYYYKNLYNSIIPV